MFKPTWYVILRYDDLILLRVTSYTEDPLYKENKFNDRDTVKFDYYFSLQKILRGEFMLSHFEGTYNSFEFHKRDTELLGVSKTIHYRKDIVEQYVRQMIEFYPKEESLKELLEELIK